MRSCVQYLAPDVRTALGETLIMFRLLLLPFLRKSSKSLKITIYSIILMAWRQTQYTNKISWVGEEEWMLIVVQINILASLRWHLLSKQHCFSPFITASDHSTLVSVGQGALYPWYMPESPEFSPIYLHSRRWSFLFHALATPKRTECAPNERAVWPPPPSFMLLSLTWCVRLLLQSVLLFQFLAAALNTPPPYTTPPGWIQAHMANHFLSRLFLSSPSATWSHHFLAILLFLPGPALPSFSRN